MNKLVSHVSMEIYVCMKETTTIVTTQVVNLQGLIARLCCFFVGQIHVTMIQVKTLLTAIFVTAGLDRYTGALCVADLNTVTTSGNLGGMDQDVFRGSIGTHCRPALLLHLSWSHRLFLYLSVWIQIEAYLNCSPRRFTQQLTETDGETSQPVKHEMEHWKLARKN